MKEAFNKLKEIVSNLDGEKKENYVRQIRKLFISIMEHNEHFNNTLNRKGSTRITRMTFYRISETRTN